MPSDADMQPQTKTQPKNLSCVYANQVAPAQNIPNNAWTTVRLDVKQFDLLDEITLATDSFTPKRAGYYLIVGRVTFQCAVLASTRQLAVWVGANIRGWCTWQPTVLFQTQTVETWAISYLTPNDIATLKVWQASGFGEPLVQPALQDYINCMQVYRLI